MNWRAIAQIGAQVASSMVPGAVQIEQAVEGLVSAKSGEEKARMGVEAGIRSLQAASSLSGKDYATPRVQYAIRRLNDDSVELLNALAEAGTPK